MPGRVEEYGRTIRYMMQQGTVSSHRVIGVTEGQHAQMVDDDLICWGAKEHNQEWIQIELAQPLPSDQYTDYQYRCAAEVCRAWAKKYGFALDREHVRGHEDMPQGLRDGKTDPGNLWNWARFIALL